MLMGGKGEEACNVDGCNCKRGRICIEDVGGGGGEIGWEGGAGGGGGIVCMGGRWEDKVVWMVETDLCGYVLVCTESNVAVAGVEDSG